MSSGIDPAPATRPQIITEKYGLRGKDYFLFLGRIDPIKRIGWLLELVPLLKCSNEGRRIVIAGGAQDSTTRSYLKGLQAACSGADACLFTGPVEGRERKGGVVVEFALASLCRRGKRACL